jgi:hypothetical protein
MESTAWLRVAVILVVLVGLALALLQWAVSDSDDWKGLALNLGTEMIGAAVTYVLFELVIERMERREAEREAEKKEREAKKADLIAQMGSSVKDVAVAAAEELERHGWLRDGSLQEANLVRANLQGAHLLGANLQGANLNGANLQGAFPIQASLQGASVGQANLQGAFLYGANLQGAHLANTKLQGAMLDGANLQGAMLDQANLQGARLLAANLQGAHLLGASLQGADFDEKTTLPDGTKWTPGTNMARFTDPKHPDFWRPGA